MPNRIPSNPYESELSGISGSPKRPRVGNAHGVDRVSPPDVDVSDRAKTVSGLVDKIYNAPDTTAERSQRVADIKAKILEGNYPITDAMVQKIVDELSISPELGIRFP